MTCDECEKQIEQAFMTGSPVYYIRVGKANVAVLGCQEHVRMLIEKLRRNDE